MPLLTYGRFLAAGVLLCCTTVELRAQDSTRPEAILTRDELVATGRPTVEAVVRRLRPQWLRFRRSADRFVQVYVDSVLARDSAVLRTLQPHEVRWVQYSTPAEARVRFDSLNRSGVLHVSTRLPLSAAHPPLPANPGFDPGAGLSLAALHLQPVWGHNYFEFMEGPGAAVTGSLPIGAGTMLMGTVRYANLDETCSCRNFEGAPKEAATMLGGEVGVKLYGGGSRAYAPFLTALLGVHQVSWKAAGTLHPAVSQSGTGASAGAGVDVRVGARMLLNAEARVSFVGFQNGLAGRLGSLGLGTTVLLGR